METFLAVTVFVVGLAGGFGACLLVVRGRVARARQDAAGDGASELATLTERIRAKDDRIEDLGKTSEARERENSELQQDNTRLKEQIAELTARKEEERKAAEEKATLLTRAQEQLSDAFKALSAEALKSNNQSFLELAKTQLEKFQDGAKGDLETRRKAVEELVKPVTESLGKVDARIGEIEKLRSEAYAKLTEQVGALSSTQVQLRDETTRLVQALHKPTVRGRWGEIQLKRVVEIAGMLAHCDFTEQESVDTDDGRLRPDMIVKLPGGKSIVVDAKAPLEAYLNAIDEQDEEVRRGHLETHARHMRDHMNALGAKAYWTHLQPTPDFVVMFLPGEAFFSAALESDPSLIERGVEQKVIPASPTTLIGLLRAASYGWTQEKLAENAQEISNIGRELSERLRVLTGHIDKMGRGLDTAVGAYNETVGSLEHRVLVSARRFSELGAGGAQPIPEISPVDSKTRRVQTDNQEPKLPLPPPAAEG